MDKASASLFKLRMGARSQSAMTLVEVLIAIALAAFVSIGLYGSAIYTMRQNERSTQQIQALTLANGFAARIRAGRYNKLTANPATLLATDYEYPLKGTTTVPSDPSGPSSPYTVTINKTGYGTGIQKNSGSSGKYTLTMGTGSAPVEANDWQGHLLVVTSGASTNRVMYIISNAATANSKTVVNLTGKLDHKSGNTIVDWGSPSPDNTSVWSIDYGMYADVTVSWDNGNKSLNETVYVPATQN